MVVPYALLVTLLLVLAGCSTVATTIATAPQSTATQAGGSGSGATGAGATSATATASAAKSPPKGPSVAHPGAVIGPSMAQVGDMLLLAGVGPNNTLAIQFQGVGAQTWNTETVAGPGTTYSRPQVVQILNGTLPLIGVAVQGPSNSLDFYWQPMSRIWSLPWNLEVLAGPGTTYSGVSIAQLGESTVAVAAEGANHSLEFFWQVVGATGWNHPLIQTITYVCGTPSLASLSNDMVGVAFVNCAGDLYFQYQSGSLLGDARQQWMFAPVGDESSNPSLVQLDNGDVAIAAQELFAGNIRLDYYYTSMVNLEEEPFFAVQVVDTSILSDPSLVQLSNGVLGMTATGANKALDFYWSKEGSGTWHTEQLNEPGMSVAQPALALVTTASGTPLVATVAEQPDGGVIFYWQVLGSTSGWSGFYLGSGTFV